MKTLLTLSADDIQNFGKLIYDPKTAQLVAVAATGVNNNNNNNINNNNNNISHSGSNNLMALQYYLKHPSNYPAATSAAGNGSGTTTHASAGTTTAGSALQQLQRPQAATTTAAHQQMLAQSQTQLKQLQLKQPTIHSTQHASYHHHHPYYQQQQQTTAPAHTPHSHAHLPHATAPPPLLPVHALNQNSNFSAASSSTGGGTASSHAPTQQSNTTGSSLSPPGATASARTTGATTNSNSTSAAQAQIRNAAGGTSSSSGGTKKLKTEPLLSQFHQTERLTFANTHIVWGEEHWRRVVFQDERKFNLDGPDGFSYYFHDLRNTERALSQRPRGNSVYIYVVIAAGGPIHLDVSTAKQRPETCIETLLRERANIVAKMGGGSGTVAVGNSSGDFVLQDHNWSANALPTAQEWLAAEGIKTQKWPTIAHDLNIMENVWGWLIREVFDGGRKFSRKDDLIFRIREAWARLPADLVANLYSTLPERVTELYYTRGVYTNC